MTDFDKGYIKALDDALSYINWLTELSEWDLRTLNKIIDSLWNIKEKKEGEQE